MYTYFIIQIVFFIFQIANAQPASAALHASAMLLAAARANEPPPPLTRLKQLKTET